MPSPSSASENAQADERVDTADATRHKRLARRRRDVPWPRKAHINCPCCRRCGVRGSLPPPRRDLLLSHMVLFFLRRCPLHLKEGAGGWALIWRHRHRPRLGLPLGSAQKREKGRQNSWLAGVRRTNGRSATRRTKVPLPKAVAERSASEQRKRKNESLVTSGCVDGDLVKKHSAEALRGSILR